MNAPRKAVYAASLDPITNGHINVIERMAPLYDELVVIVAEATHKTYLFTTPERVYMAKAAVAHLPNVTVTDCVGRYVVNQASEIGAQVIIRGLRNFKDLEDEQIVAEENRRICPQIETVWVPCLPDLMHVSSSMVKGHIGTDPGWEEQVARSVPRVVVENLKKKFVLGKARKHWVALMLALGNPKGSDEVFKKLIASYSEPHRAYHTLGHIVTMLDELEEVRGLLVDPDIVAMGVWYHDVVYRAEARNHQVIASNEERSAYQAELDLRGFGLAEDFIRRVGEMVEATAHTAPVSDPDSQFLVDLDLAILGRSEKEFDAYEADIRKEYSWVPAADFSAGRSRILQSFLDRNSIYSTQFFRERYESTARKNLGKSIEMLLK